ncbi:MAG: UDP-N-acetylmuramoyl-tripeptide--D-alanyl-D-alanine ligase, partial [Spirochaetales bacterium]|nr:UDP-N-acetylmuramoyl-tripeptide--D-alanyl-D-alanine ligase [Spirochaetales bacterium]
MSTRTAARLEITGQRLAEMVGGKLAVAGPRRIQSVSIDSRTLAPGALFVPLAGSRVD